MTTQTTDADVDSRDVQYGMIKSSLKTSGASDSLAGAIADAAEDRWRQVIKDYDPGQIATPRKIERLVDEACNAWDLGEDGRYTDERELEWCGYLVGASARHVGDYLEPNTCVDVALARPIAVYCLGSTSRLAQPEWWDKADADGPQQIPEHDIERGDIVVVETTGAQTHGDHITLARSAPNTDGTIPTVEGNATGTLGDQTQGEGVVVRTRHVNDVHAVYRLDKSHFEGTDL